MDLQISEHENDQDQRKSIYSEIAKYAVMRWGREEARERLNFYVETLFGVRISPDALGIDEPPDSCQFDTGSSLPHWQEWGSKNCVSLL